MDNIIRKLYRELDKMDEKYAAENKEFSMADIEVLDKITHTLKCLSALGGGSSRDGMSRGSYDYSERRGRDSMGRYTSRDVEPGRDYPMYDRGRY